MNNACRWIWLGVGVLIGFWVLFNIGIWANHAFLDCEHPFPSLPLHLDVFYRPFTYKPTAAALTCMLGTCSPHAASRTLLLVYVHTDGHSELSPLLATPGPLQLWRARRSRCARSSRSSWRPRRRNAQGRAARRSAAQTCLSRPTPPPTASPPRTRPTAVRGALPCLHAGWLHGCLTCLGHECQAQECEGLLVRLPSPCASISRPPDAPGEV